MPHTAPLAGDLRRSSRVDDALTEIGRALQILTGAAQAGRPNPAGKPLLRPEDDAAGLSAAQRRHAAGLMRVNHVGEVCAQALYRGQAMRCTDPAVKQVLLDAAAEEVDHLVWCRDRLRELDSHTSYLNPLWYAGSMALGVLASGAGVPRNLGFMAETERQVSAHLDSHLEKLPSQDQRSRRIVEQMREDEAQHCHTAETHGAQALPGWIKQGMKLMSRVMTTTAYRI